MVFGKKGFFKSLGRGRTPQTPEIGILNTLDEMVNKRQLDCRRLHDRLSGVLEARGNTNESLALKNSEYTEAFHNMNRLCGQLNSTITGILNDYQGKEFGKRLERATREMREKPVNLTGHLAIQMTNLNKLSSYVQIFERTHNALNALLNEESDKARKAQ